MWSARLARPSLAGLKLEVPNRIRERMNQMPTILPQIDEADGVLDELQAWFLARADAERWVYTSVLRQLVNRMYRDRDYLDRRKARGTPHRLRLCRGSGSQSPRLGDPRHRALHPGRGESETRATQATTQALTPLIRCRTCQDSRASELEWAAQTRLDRSRSASSDTTALKADLAQRKDFTKPRTLTWKMRPRSWCGA